jgi:hypothetical protein
MVKVGYLNIVMLNEKCFACTGLDVVALDSHNKPVMSEIDAWSHFTNSGQIAIRLKYSCLNAIIFYYKNEKYEKVITDFFNDLPPEIIEKLIIIKFPAQNKYIFLYRYVELEDENYDTFNDIFILADNVNDVRLFVYLQVADAIPFTKSSYEIIQGQFNLETMEIELHNISYDEREIIVTNASNLDYYILQN